MPKGCDDLNVLSSEKNLLAYPRETRLRMYPAFMDLVVDAHIHRRTYTYVLLPEYHTHTHTHIVRINIRTDNVDTRIQKQA